MADMPVRTKRSPRPTACTACGVTLRPKSTPNVPGTRTHMGRGLCSACWKRKRYGFRPMPERPPECSSCGRDWDTVTFTARGLCTGCYSTQRYRETTKRVRHPMPATCTGCSRPLRKVGTEAPGTVVFAANGLCGSCYNAGRTVTPLITPTQCTRCERPMRTRAKAAPGFVTHCARGLCTSCYGTTTRQEKQILAFVLGGAA